MSLAPSLDAPRAKSSSFVAAPHIFALGALALGAFSLAVLNDGDTWSHIATGEWILDHRAVPRVDPFSLTFAGAPWVAHEWLAEVIFALAFRAAGWAAVMVVTGAAAALAAYTIAEKTIKALPGIGGPVLALAALALVTPGLLARPHVLALPILAIWCVRLFDARDKREAPPLALALLMALWANLHGGFAFGLALIAPLAFEAVWEAGPSARFAEARKWALFFVVSVVAALITPFGVQGLLFPIRLLGFSQLANIGEWRAEDFSHPGPLEIFLIGLIAVALLRPLRVTPLRVALIAGLIHLALQHARHEMLLAVVAPMILARPAAEALGEGPPAPPLNRRWTAGALVVGLALAVARIMLPTPEIDSSAAPSRALAAIPEKLRAEPVLNSYSFGGFLIFAHVRPFIDGRADMYGARFLSLYQRLASGDGELLEATLKRYDIAWTLFAPEQGAVATLDRLAGWRRLYSDAHAVVHVRDASGVNPSEPRGD
jgi:hypothetical protein